MLFVEVYLLLLSALSFATATYLFILLYVRLTKLPQEEKKKPEKKKSPVIRTTDSLVNTNTPPSRVKVISIILAILVAVSFCILVWIVEGQTILENVRVNRASISSNAQ